MQEAFSHLIGEQNELTQELASQGLSIVYELGDDDMKKGLVNALVGTLTGSGKRKRAVKVGIYVFVILYFNDMLSCVLLSAAHLTLLWPSRIYSLACRGL